MIIAPDSPAKLKPVSNNFSIDVLVKEVAQNHVVVSFQGKIRIYPLAAIEYIEFGD